MSRLRAFLLVGPFLLSTACTLMPRQERGHPATPLPLPAPSTYTRPTLRQPTIYKRAHLDTLILPAGRILTLYPAPRPIYESLPTPAWLRPIPSAADEELDLTAEERARLRTTGRTAQRVGRTLWLRPSAAPPVRFVDNPVENEDNIAYEYVDAIPAIHQWLISVHLYEGGYFLLVDQRTGRRTEVWSPPAISPDGLHFVCGNSDVLAHYDPSGLQLWAADGLRLRKLWERQVEWGVSGPRWLDNRTILFEQDYLEKGDVETRLVRLTIIP
ncbi:hypothetical protein H8B15_19620 [Hymenobacter sp. BT507]|uniref:Bulb-type lectin domain-containing protein n=1 Tax=Hymenobacter citatus TaxID=2763506 RepID=A0ABR7MPY0_9BACT|nr:hypothetical protein [Hymenobacter citatus]MBC6613141.1 hypothetical protein [Hymenobacter citatus]